MNDGPYSVNAYRDGYYNGGHIALPSWLSRWAAKEAAEEYADYRGGKYGVEVRNHTNEVVHYVSSSLEEDHAEWNQRIYDAETVGSLIRMHVEKHGDMPRSWELKRMIPPKWLGGKA